MKKQAKLVMVLVSVFVLSLITPIVLADSSGVTTRWIVPADTTIGISYPNSESEIEFNAAGQNFSELGATSQTGSLSALRVTNDGNTAIEVNASWSVDFPTGVDYVNISMYDNTNATHFIYAAANETVNQTWNASLGVGNYNDFWFWSCGTEVAETAGIDRTLVVYSRNV